MKKFVVLFGVVLTVALSLGVPASAQQPQSYRAFAVSMPAGVAGQVDIVFERWSSEAEREKLIAAFNEKGQDGLLSALQKVKPRAGRYGKGNAGHMNRFFAVLVAAVLVLGIAGPVLAQVKSLPGESTVIPAPVMRQLGRLCLTPFLRTSRRPSAAGISRWPSGSRSAS